MNVLIVARGYPTDKYKKQAKQLEKESHKKIKADIELINLWVWKVA